MQLKRFIHWFFQVDLMNLEKAIRIFLYGNESIFEFNGCGYFISSKNRKIMKRIRNFSILINVTYIFLFSFTAGYVFEYGWIVGVLCMVGICLLLWVWPNYIYWHYVRRYLFNKLEVNKTNIVDENN